MKKNKTVLNLIERAYAKGGEARIVRNGREVYRVNVGKNEAVLYHYGTAIARIANGSGEVLAGAYSASDRDAINNFFEAHYISTRVAIRQGVLQIA